MRKFEFVQGSCAGPFSEYRQAQFEKYHGIRLDSEFVALCQQCNGGVPVLRCFDVAGRERMIDRFLCLLESIYVSSADAHVDYDIGVTWTQIEDRLRPGLIPIAVLFAGDMLCLRYKAEYDWDSDPDDDVDDDTNIVGYLPMPTVCVWDHEQSREFRPVLTPVADSFGRFLELLHEPR